MDSIAEVMTEDQTYYLIFDDKDRKQILEVERVVGDMADEGLVLDMSIYPRH